MATMRPTGHRAARPQGRPLPGRSGVSARFAIVSGRTANALPARAHGRRPASRGPQNVANLSKPLRRNDKRFG
jgi:hypothetical protein